MSSTSQKQLVNKLHEKTNGRSVKWESTIEEDVFQVSFSRNSVKISKIENRRGNASDYRIDLINSQGVIADSFDDVKLDSSEIQSVGHWFSKMKDLHEAARRSALGSDEVLSDIIQELDDSFPF